MKGEDGITTPLLELEKRSRVDSNLLTYEGSGKGFKPKFSVKIVPYEPGAFNLLFVFDATGCANEEAVNTRFDEELMHFSRKYHGPHEQALSEEDFLRKFEESYKPGWLGGHWARSSEEMSRKNIITYAGQHPNSATAKALNKMSELGGFLYFRIILWGENVDSLCDKLNELCPGVAYANEDAMDAVRDLVGVSHKDMCKQGFFNQLVSDTSPAKKVPRTNLAGFLTVYSHQKIINQLGALRQ